FYGDTVTDSMQQAINETARRRAIQAAFNEQHGIVPMSIHKAVLKLEYADAYTEPEQLMLAAEAPAAYSEADEAVDDQIQRLELEMKAAAKELEFERAAAIRNRIRALRLRELELKSGGERR
ncbi:MAG TPA: UvrB/UvrC motif-containing protein, partial [Nitrospira sp.]|nr:UvrB/UvrC motif-containing protein [Nitrospira sp.]